jgi:MYXO-CTERM domain-containing protein
MRRIAFAILTVVVIALPPAAVAKGPHATVSSLPVGVDPDQPWAATLTLVEYRRRAVADARPTVIFRSAGQRLAVTPKRLGVYVPRPQNVMAEARYRLRVAFPRAGRWTFTVLDGTNAGRRFRFPPAVVGTRSGRPSGAYVAFPEGSRAEAAGAGGPLMGDAGPGGGGRSLPPEVFLPAEEESDGAGGMPWIPATGLALAGLGGLAMLRHRRRRPQ